MIYLESFHRSPSTWCLVSALPNICVEWSKIRRRIRLWKNFGAMVVPVYFNISFIVDYELMNMIKRFDLKYPDQWLLRSCEVA